MDLQTENGRTMVSLEPNSNETTKMSRKWWHIDRKMVPYKLHFFLLTGAFGAVNPFISVFVLKRLKFSATSFAAVVLAMNLGQVLAKPIICFIIDYFNKLKAVLCILCVCQILAYFSLFSIPEPTSNTASDEIQNDSLSDSGSLWICEGSINISRYRDFMNDFLPVQNEFFHSMNLNEVNQDVPLNDFNLIWCKSGVNNQMWNVYKNIDGFSSYCQKISNFAVEQSDLDIDVEMNNTTHLNQFSFLCLVCPNGKNVFDTSDDVLNSSSLPPLSFRCHNASEQNLSAEMSSNTPGSDLKSWLFWREGNINKSINSFILKVSLSPCLFNRTDTPHALYVVECGSCSNNVSSTCYFNTTSEMNSSFVHSSTVCLNSTNASSIFDSVVNCNNIISLGIRCYDASESEIPYNIPSSNLKSGLFLGLGHLAIYKNKSFLNVFSAPCSIRFNETDAPHASCITGCCVCGLFCGVGHLLKDRHSSSFNVSPCFIWLNHTHVPHSFKGTEWDSCGSYFNRTAEVTSSLRTLHKNKSSDFESYRFWLFATFAVIEYICWGCLLVLSETVCCENVQKHGSDYGKQRLFGAVGWGLMSALGGVLCDYTENYLSVCAIAAVMCTGMIWNFSKMDFEKPDFSLTYFRDVSDAFRSRDFVAFAVGALVNGIGCGIVWFYLVWFLTTIGGTDVLSGLVHTAQNFLGELPFMFFSSWIIEKLGYFNTTTLSVFSHCVHFFYISYLQNPWYVLLMEWNPGLYYGVYYVAVVGFAKKNAKPGTEATMQGILFVLFDSVGSAIGNVVTGISIDHFGGHLTFYYSGICFGCFTLISFVYAQFCQETVHFCKASSKIYAINT